MTDKEKEMYKKTRDPHAEEIVFEPPKAYFYFGENVSLMDESQACDIIGISHAELQELANKGIISRIVVSKNNESKPYFLKHECEKLKHEEKKNNQEAI
jgi:hypothetical protein